MKPEFVKMLSESEVDSKKIQAEWNKEADRLEAWIKSALKVWDMLKIEKVLLDYPYLDGDVKQIFFYLSFKKSKRHLMAFSVGAEDTNKDKYTAKIGAGVDGRDMQKLPWDKKKINKLNDRLQTKGKFRKYEDVRKALEDVIGTFSEEDFMKL